MLKRFSTLIVVLFTSLFTSVPAFSQFLFEGDVATKGGAPAQGATVVNTNYQDGDQTRNKAVSTGADGHFKIKVMPDDLIKISFVGSQDILIHVGDKSSSSRTYILEDKGGEMQSVVVSATSTRSIWVNAKIGYNFDGFSDDNYFVGAAKISINPMKKSSSSPFHTDIIGNVANFISSQNYADNAETNNKNLQKLSQSTQGLFLGLGQLYEGRFNGNNKVFYRPYFTTGYRLNTFKNIGPDSVTVNLSQFRSSLGFEIEGFEFVNGGAMNFSVEGSLAFFDKNRYNQVFGEKKGSLATFEATVILPITSKLGFFANGTYAPKMSAVYLIGLVVR